MIEIKKKRFNTEACQMTTVISYNETHIVGVNPSPTPIIISEGNEKRPHVPCRFFKSGCAFFSECAAVKVGNNDNRAKGCRGERDRDSASR